jgi:exo-1,4-beta-D-glucosaminidase
VTIYSCLAERGFLRALVLIGLSFLPYLATQPSAQPLAEAPNATPAPLAQKITLAKGWSIQSSAKVAQKGEDISMSGFRHDGWYAASVPTTVVAALVDNGLYPDPYFGKNLVRIPATPKGNQNFSNNPMPANSPFAVPWWYRTEFKLPSSTKGRRLWLNFDAINYRANIWLNGKQIGSADKVVGMYRMFEFDITDVAIPGEINALAVEVTAPTQNDFTITFVDWNPIPGDKDMGLVRDVYIRTSGPVSLRNTQVVTKIDNPPTAAHLTLYADLKNATDKPVEGILTGTIDAISVYKQVKLAPYQSARVTFKPARSAALNISNPKLWWPYGLGPQNLHDLHMEFVTGGTISDSEDVRFGIREITAANNDQKHRVFTVNGKKILIRGAGWTSDMMMRYDDAREASEIAYARDMNLNTIRLEGKLMNEHFFKTADEMGMMVMPGWCCCSYWERWRDWKPEDYTLAEESLRDQIRKIRNNPSVFVWLYGSDNSPHEQAERAYLKVLEEENWPNPHISSAVNQTSVLTGITGMKMTGPYEYVAPNYWLLDKTRGGAFGFNTETSPGPAVPVIESLHEMLPKEHLWPIDSYWDFHAGRGSYGNLNVFTAALEGRYGKVKGLEDYVQKSQLMAYEGERAMFEAFGRNKYSATGVVQWMLNNAWPSTIWHLYDWYLRPGGGYFGTKIANERLHIQYSYDDQSIAVVNSNYKIFKSLKATAEVYNLDLTEKFSKTASVDIGEDGVVRAFEIPKAIDGLSKTYFLKLTLGDETGKQVSSNFYWLSTQPDVNDFVRSNGRYTPISTYADLTGLQDMPQAQVTVTSRTEVKGAEQVEHITVQNPSSKLAFFVHLTLYTGKNGPDVKPVIWEDNYITLFPGEEREITATFAKNLLGGAAPLIKIDGINVPPSE